MTQSPDQATDDRSRQTSRFRLQRAGFFVLATVLVLFGLGMIFYGTVLSGQVAFECFGGRCATNDPRMFISIVGVVVLAAGALFSSFLITAPSSWRIGFGGAAMAGALAMVTGALVGGPATWSPMLVAFLVGQIVAGLLFFLARRGRK